MNEEDIFADILGDNKLTDDDSFEKAVENKKEDIFDETDEQDEEKPAESQTEKEEKEDSPSQQGEDDSEGDEDSDDNTDAAEKTPFHKRWAKREQKLTEDFNKKIEDLESKFSKPVEDADAPMLDWFKTMAGDDEIAQNAFKQFSAWDKKSKDALKKQWKDDQKAEVTQQKQEADKWSDWVDDEVDRLKGEGKKFSKNELLNIAVNYQPIGEDGNISMDKAFEIYEMQKTSKKDPVKTNKKKIIASDSTSTSNQEVSTVPGNLRNTAWSDLA